MVKDRVNLSSERPQLGDGRSRQDPLDDYWSRAGVGRSDAKEQEDSMIYWQGRTDTSELKICVFHSLPIAFSVTNLPQILQTCGKKGM